MSFPSSTNNTDRMATRQHESEQTGPTNSRVLSRKKRASNAETGLARGAITVEGFPPNYEETGEACALEEQQLKDLQRPLRLLSLG